MKNRKKILISFGLLAAAITGMNNITLASESADTYSQACRVCHTGTATPDVHHRLIAQGIDCFYGCHQFKWNLVNHSYYLANNGNICFLNCHTPILYRDSDRFFDRVTSEVADSLGWDITGSAKTKIGDLHHQNYGAPVTDCGRCHEFYWDTETSAEMIRPVTGSAGEGAAAEDANNINIVIENNQLVYDIGPGETLYVNALATEGDIATVRWSINGQEISTATNSLTFAYTFKWAYPGDTFVVKLETWSNDGRYAKQNIGVNIR